MSLTTPAEFIRSLQAHSIDPSAFCTHLLHSGVSGDGTIRPSQTADEFRIDPDAATHLYDLASEFDLVRFSIPTSNSVTVNESATIEFLQFLNYFESYASASEIALLAEDNIHDVELTVSVPHEFEGRSAELMARLIRFVRNADEQLLVVTPFFTRFGVDTFVDHLATATNRGVQITVLTRDVTGGSNNEDHIRRFQETINATGVIENLDIFEYDSPHGHLHAKALISDTSSAYVGSANFTNYSLKEAIEIGLIVKGPVVQELSDFFDTVRRSSDTQRIGAGLSSR